MPLSSTELISLYEQMARIRATEIVQNDLWHEGLVSGEMHSGIGEEAIAAGIAGHLGAGDAVACDHRPTGPFVAAGVDVTTLLLEMLGDERGLGRGRAGHMHLMSRAHLHIADGIVGSSGPAACGFAFSATHERPGSIAVAYFGEGALNQGMLMEAFNLAKVWSLPVLFVCKDNRWSITTRSREVTAGSPLRRAAAFGLRSEPVDGADVRSVSRVTGRLIDRMRRRPGPAFVHARCRRPDGHFLGDPMLRMFSEPLGQARELGGPMMAAARRPSAIGLTGRLSATATLGWRLAAVGRGRMRQRTWDPLERCERELDEAVARSVRERVHAEVAAAADRAREQAGVSR